MADTLDLIVKNDTQWDISYTVEKDGFTNSFCITVLKSAMSDPDSETEARTLANAEASEIKTDWTPAVSASTVILDEPESVTL